jgi:hypothetical protein
MKLLSIFSTLTMGSLVRVFIEFVSDAKSIFSGCGAATSGKCLEQPANIINASNVSAISDVRHFMFSSQTTNSQQSCAP